MEGGEIVSTLLPSYVKLCLDDCPKYEAHKVEIEKVPYLSAIGSFMYVVICTRLNINFIMGLVINR